MCFVLQLYFESRSFVRQLYFGKSNFIHIRVFRTLLIFRVMGLFRTPLTFRTKNLRPPHIFRLKRYRKSVFRKLLIFWIKQFHMSVFSTPLIFRVYNLIQQFFVRRFQAVHVPCKHTLSAIHTTHRLSFCSEVYFQCYIQLAAE